MRSVFGGRRPSASLVVAMLALIVAVGGGSYAVALNKKDKKVIRKVANGQITKRYKGLSVGHATSADSASNASTLGGIPPSGYTHSDCNSTTGQAKGLATVPASGTFSSTFATIGGYNCSGQAVQAKRINTGWYEVRWLGNPSTFALGTSNDGAGGIAFDDNVSVLIKGAGDFIVTNDQVATHTEVDHPFNLVLY
jgi:hypothetical protein